MKPHHKFGLSLETITRINAVFAKHSQIKKVILYGSRSKGNYREGSDIDLTLDAPDLTTSELLKIENDLEELMLPYKIDLSLMHQIEGTDLIEHIQRVGKEFHEG